MNRHFALGAPPSLDVAEEYARPIRVVVGNVEQVKLSDPTTGVVQQEHFGPSSFSMAIEFRQSSEEGLSFGTPEYTHDQMLAQKVSLIPLRLLSTGDVFLCVGDLYVRSESGQTRRNVESGQLVR